jgi:hypothetical protein
MVDAREFTHNILNQYNSSTNPQNRLISQYFTDPDLEAYMKGADDILIPSNLALNLNCTRLSITFVMVRVKHDQNPQFVTVEFFYDDETNSSSRPGILFYSRHFNSMVWDNISLNKVFNMTFDFNNGDMNEVTDGAVFDLSNESFFPPNKKIWISFHATGPRDFSFAGFEENCLYWITHGNSPVNAKLYDNITLNQQYHFIDLNNSMREGLQQWTRAEIAEPLLGLNSHSYNLAWNVELVCHDDSITEHPTLSPTTTTTTSSPTFSPTTIISPPPPLITESPTLNENITVDPPTLFNYTILETIDKKAVLIGIAIPIAIIALCCLCLCFCYRKWRRKKTEKQKQSAEIELLDKGYVNENIKLDDNITTEIGDIFSNGINRYNNNDDEIEMKSFNSNNNNNNGKKKQS